MKMGYTKDDLKEKRFFAFHLDTRLVTASCLRMEQILVIGASGGIGAALCSALDHQGYQVLKRSRSGTGFDITCDASVNAGLEGVSGLSGIIVATGALEIHGSQPEKSIKAISSKAMADQFALNAIGPALVLKHAARLLRKDTRTVFAILSARVGSIGDNRLGGWISYRAAKAAVNQVVRTGAIELARTHPKSICVALHPGTVQTRFTEKYVGRHPAIAPDEAARGLLQVLSHLPQRATGGFFDWQGKEVPW